MRTKDARLVRLAERQHSVFSRAQAIAIGFTPDEIKGRVQRGLWMRVHRGVYRLPGARPTFEGRVMAAILAAGHCAVASFTTAGRLWKFERIVDTKIHISVPGRDRIRVPGVVIHTPSRLESRDVTKMEGVPITVPQRTVMDLSSCVARLILDDVLDDARRRELVRVQSLLVRVRSERKRGRSGLKLLEELLIERVGEPAPGSTREKDVRRFFKVAGLPAPVPQYKIRDANGAFIAKVDFAYPDVKLVVEFDGYEKHSSRRQWKRTAFGRTNSWSADGSHCGSQIDSCVTSRATSWMRSGVD